MNAFMVNFNSPETSTNSTSLSVRLTDLLEISVYCIYFLFSFPMNCYVIWFMVVSRKGVAADFLNFNLSLVFVLSTWFSSLRISDSFLLGLTFTGRPLFQCLICVERYLAVVHPVTYLKYKPLRYRVICCTPVWIINLGSYFVCMYNFASNNKLEHAWFLTVELTLVISIQLFFLVSVTRVLKQSGPGQRVRETVEENPMKIKTLHLILKTTVTVIIPYFPFAIVTPMKRVNPLETLIGYCRRTASQFRIKSEDTRIRKR